MYWGRCQGIYIYNDNTLKSKQCEESSIKLSKSLFKNIQKIGYTIKLGNKNEWL